MLPPRWPWVDTEVSGLSSGRRGLSRQVLLVRYGLLRHSFMEGLQICSCLAQGYGLEAKGHKKGQIAKVI